MMKIHTKNYFKAFGINESDYLYCTVCGKGAIDIHHIEPKGMGGSKNKDSVENLISLCRECHIIAHNDNTLERRNKYKQLQKQLLEGK